MEPSIITIVYCIIINTYNPIINLQYNYISNEGLLEECDQEENFDVTGFAPISCLKRTLKNVLSSVTYSPSHRQAEATTINIPSTLRTAPDLCKHFSFAVLFGISGSSYTVSLQVGIPFTMYRLWSEKNERN